MARAVNPRLGEDGYGLAPLPSSRLSEQEVKPLLEYFGARSTVRLTDLTQWLAEIELQYFKGADRGADAFSRAEARAALDHVLKQAKVTCHDVICLNERAIDAVINELMMTLKAPKKGGGVVERFYANQLRRPAVRAACEAARVRLVDTHGPDRNFAMAHCVSQLCELYESLAGTKITLSNKGEHLAYVEAPCSIGGEFVFEALKLIAQPSDRHAEQTLARAASRYIRDWIEFRGP